MSFLVVPEGEDKALDEERARRSYPAELSSVKARLAKAKRVGVWTDDYSNLWSVLNW